VGPCLSHDSNVKGGYTVCQISASVTSQGMVHASKWTGKCLVVIVTLQAHSQTINHSECV